MRNEECSRGVRLSAYDVGRLQALIAARGETAACARFGIAKATLARAAAQLPIIKPVALAIVRGLDAELTAEVPR